MSPGRSALYLRVRRGLLVSSLNNILVRLGNLFVTIALARLLAPAQFGVYAVALTVQSVLVALADLGVGADLVRHGDVERRGATVASIGLAAGTLMAVLMAGTAAPVSALMGSAGAATVVQVMSLTLVLSGLGVVPYAIMQREFMQGRQLVCDVTGLVTQAGATFALIALGAGPMSLAVARVVSQAVVTALQFGFTHRRPTFGWNRDIAADAVTFGLPISGANLLSWIVISVDNVLVGNSLGGRSLGLYVMAFNLSSWPINTVGTAVRSVSLPGFAQVSHDLAAAQRALTRAASLTWTLAVPLAALLVIFGEPLVVFLYGPRWAPAAAALSGLGAFGALRVLFDLLAAFLYSRGRSAGVLWTQIAWLGALVPVMILGIHRWGLAGAGWAHLATGALVILPVYLLQLRRDGLSVRPVLRESLPAVAACVPAALVAWWVHVGVKPLFAQLALGGVAFTICYLACLGPWLLGLRGPTGVPMRHGAAPGARRSTPTARHRTQPIAFVESELYR